MEEKKKKIVQHYEIAIPLRLFGCKYNTSLCIEICNDGKVNIVMSANKDDILKKYLPADFDGSGQAILHFEKQKHPSGDFYCCATFGYNVWTEKSIDELMQLKIDTTADEAK